MTTAAAQSGRDATLSPSDLCGRRVTVMGLGRFGGGGGAARFLIERGARVTLTDLQTEDELHESLVQLAPCSPAAIHLGGHREADFRDTDLIVVNPAVPPDNRFLQIARAAGVPLTSEIRLFWQLNRGRVIGVTGSNGKSTTAALIHSLLMSAGFTSHLGGNIGRSLLPIVDQIQPDDWVVLELSSFQLEDLDKITVRPDVAVVTSFSPNHLDRHGTIGAYRRAKQTLLRYQRSDDVAVLNRDDEDIAGWNVRGRTLWFGTTDDGRDGVFAVAGRLRIRNDQGKTRQLPDIAADRLPGEHNRLNIAAAIAAAAAVGASEETVPDGIERFAPLPHRLEFIAEISRREFYNDSLATTPESTVAAIRAFSRPIVLLAGGSDKQIDLAPLAEAITRECKAVALMGETGRVLAELIAALPGSATISRHVCRSLAEAFDWACGQSAAGDVVLLSPGCASYDWFRNFSDRGHQFVRLVQERPEIP